MGTLLPFVGMVMVILAQVSSMVITKAAMSNGVNKYVLIVYSNALSSLVLLPCSFIFHRSVHLPSTSSNLYRLIFLLALIGCVGQLCGYAGIQYSSPATATAMLNLVPAFTFILAIIFRMEQLEWRSTSSQAKFLGTVISITGAFVVTFYKGPIILSTQSLVVLPHQLLFSPQLNWVLGGLLLAAEAFINSAWYIIQTLVLKKFPAVLTVMFYLCFFNAILSTIYSLFLVKDPSAWKLRPDIGLVAILYSAIVAITFRISLCSWCLWKAGPLYVSMFKPLAIIFAAVMGIVFLGDVLCLGSVIGAIIIVTGFYAVLWGKAKEEKMGEESGVESLESSSQKVPLLQNRIED
ncbi:WAT1-related protein At5g40240-like isoform X2 [Durio zibethinus]|uniref:WAT1-related protein n=1 Tax=Durio zibethinus TaxID=66656 RepID=A0A6P5XD16_DURZI|nr:WAT1-related protein At5g40240-like isoform X2 [Durio zibethinus]